jgi:hypothetical protein
LITKYLPSDGCQGLALRVLCILDIRSDRQIKSTQAGMNHSAAKPRIFHSVVLRERSVRRTPFLKPMIKDIFYLSG